MQSIDELAAYLKDAATAQRPGEQFWLGIAGAPGSGKSTLSAALQRRLGDMSVVIPMDGYHYSRRELDLMSNPHEAHQRRGAPFTFDAARFVRDLADARSRQEGLFPEFDHGAGDPVKNKIRMTKSQHQLVIVEGNYLLLDDEPWNQIRRLLDESWFLNCDVEICKQRVRKRFLATGRDESTAHFRVEHNDGPNARLVNEVSPKNADRVLDLEEI